MIHRKDSFFLNSNSINKIIEPSYNEVEPDILLEDNDFIDVNSFKLKVFHSEGHTPGSVLQQLQKMKFFLETQFKNSIGRTDLEYGNSKKMKETIIKILDYFKKDYTIYPSVMVI